MTDTFAMLNSIRRRAGLRETAYSDGVPARTSDEDDYDSRTRYEISIRDALVSQYKQLGVEVDQEDVFVDLSDDRRSVSVSVSVGEELSVAVLIKLSETNLIRENSVIAITAIRGYESLVITTVFPVKIV